MTTNEAALKLAREIIELSSQEPPINGLTRTERTVLAAILEVTERAAGFVETEAVAPGQYGIDLRKFKNIGDWFKAGRAAALRNMEHLHE